jgi:general secretion pathway protein F
MPIYRYKAYHPQGGIRKGEIEAESRRILIERLNREQYIPLEIEEIKTSSSRHPILSLFRGRISARDTALFTRQLATLLRAGLPLVEALSATVEQAEESALKAVILGVRDRVNEGTAFHEALKAYPQAFSDLYINMVRAGEASGTLEIVMDRLSDFLERQLELKNQILSTMAYPVIMIFAMIGVVSVLFVYVIPKIVQVFEHTGTALPLPTRILIFLATTMREHGIILLLLMFAGGWSFRKLVRTPRGRAFWDRLVIRLPVLGPVIRHIIYSRFSRTLATLLASGVSLPTSLEILRALVGNTVYAQAIAFVEERVISGSGLSEPLKSVGIFPTTLVRMVRAGEASGELELMLQKIADAFDREVSLRINVFMRLLEPLMIILLGGLVFFIMASILIPMFKINQLVR